MYDNFQNYFVLPHTMTYDRKLIIINEIDNELLMYSSLRRVEKWLSSSREWIPTLDNTESGPVEDRKLDYEYPQSMRGGCLGHLHDTLALEHKEVLEYNTQQQQTSLDYKSATDWMQFSKSNFNKTLFLYMTCI